MATHETVIGNQGHAINTGIGTENNENIFAKQLFWTDCFTML